MATTKPNNELTTSFQAVSVHIKKVNPLFSVDLKIVFLQLKFLTKFLINSVKKIVQTNHN